MSAGRQPVSVKANDLLQGARCSLVSPSGSGRAMSRQEVADAVNSWLFEHRARRGCVDAGYVGKLERGIIRWPREDLRAALRAVLGAPSDRDLGLFVVYSRDRAVPDDDVAAAEEDVPAVLRAAELEDGFTALGASLRKWRVAAEMTQTDLAEGICYSRSTVTNVEIGKQPVRRESWRRADQHVGAGGVLLEEFDHLNESAQLARANAAAERAAQLAQEAFGARALAGRLAEAPGIVVPLSAALNGSGLTLAIGFSELGGLRIVIETGERPLPNTHSATGTDASPNGGQVISMNAARHLRQRRRE
jgi:transcriptional regulator with XRE-family HTH domain